MDIKDSVPGSIDSLLGWPDSQLFGSPLSAEELRTAAGPPIEDLEAAKSAMARVAMRCSSFVRCENSRHNKLNLDRVLNAIKVVEFFYDEYSGKDDILSAFVSKRKYIEPYTEILLEESNSFLLNFREVFAVTNFLVKLAFPFCFTNFGGSFRTAPGLATLYLLFAPISVYVVETGPSKEHQKEHLENCAYEYGVSKCHGKTLYEVASDLFKAGYTGDAHREAISLTRSYMFTFESEDDLNTLVANLIFISLVYFLEVWEMFVNRQDKLPEFFDRVQNKRLVFRIMSIMFALKETAVMGLKILNAFDIGKFFQTHSGDLSTVTDMFNMLKLVGTRGVSLLSEIIVKKCLVAVGDLDELCGPHGKALSKTFFLFMNNSKARNIVEEEEVAIYIISAIGKEEKAKGQKVTKKTEFFLKVLNFLMEKNMNPYVPAVFAQFGAPKIEFTPEKMNSFPYLNFLLTLKVPIPPEAFGLFSKVNTYRQALKALKLFVAVPEATCVFDKVIQSMVLTLEPSGGEELFGVLRSLLERNPELQERVVDILNSALNNDDYKKRMKIAERTSWIIDGLYPEKAVLEKIISYKGASIVKNFFGDIVSKKVISKSKLAETFKILLLVDEGDRILPFIRVLFCARPVPEDQAYLFKILALRGDYIFSYPACVDIIMDTYANCADPSKKPMLEVAHDFLVETKSEKYSAELFGLVDKLLDVFLGLDEAQSSSTILAFAESFLDSLFWMSKASSRGRAFVQSRMHGKLSAAFNKLVRVFKAAVSESPASVKAAAVPFGRLVRQDLMFSKNFGDITRELWSSPAVMLALPEDFQNGIAYSISLGFIQSLGENSDPSIVETIVSSYLPLAVLNETVWSIFHGVMCKFQEVRPENARICFDIIRDKMVDVTKALASSNEEEFTKALGHMNACTFYFSSTLVFVDKYGMTLNKINVNDTLRMFALVLDTIVANKCAGSVLSKNKDAQSDLFDIASSISVCVSIVAVGQKEPSFPNMNAVNEFSDMLLKSSVFPFPNPHVSNDAIMDVICSMVPVLEYVGSDKRALLDRIIDLINFVHTVDIPHLERHLDNIISVLGRCVRDDKSGSCYDSVVILLTLLIWQPEDDAFNFTYKARKSFDEDQLRFNLFRCFLEYTPLKKNDPRVLFVAAKYTTALIENPRTLTVNPHLDEDRELILSKDGLNSDEFKSKLFVFEKLASIVSDKNDGRSEFASRVLSSIILRTPVLQYYLCNIYDGDVVTDAFMTFFQHRPISFDIEECSKFISRYSMGTVFLQRLLAKTYCALLDAFLSENEDEAILKPDSVPLHILSLSEVLSIFIHFANNPREKASVIRILVDNKVPQKLCSGIIGRLDFAHYVEHPQKDPVSTIFVLLFSIIRVMAPSTKDDKFAVRWDTSLRVQEVNLKTRITDVLMRIMSQSEAQSDEIETTSFDSFMSWISSNLESPPAEAGPHDTSLLARLENSEGSTGGDEWVEEQKVRLSEMSEEFTETDIEPLKYELSFDCSFKNAFPPNIIGNYGDILNKYIERHLLIVDPNRKINNPNLDLDIAIVAEALDNETRDIVLQAKGNFMLNVLLRGACAALGVESGSTMKIEGAENDLGVAATAVVTQNAFSSPEVIVPLVKMLYCTEECFPAEIVENILSCICRIPFTSSTIFDLIVSLLFVSFKACPNVKEEERQELISIFLHRNGVDLSAFADNPLFKSLLNTRAVISTGHIVFRSVSASGEVSVYGDVCDGVPDLTSQVVTRLFTTLRSMIMDKDKGIPVSHKQFSMLLTVMAVVLSKFFDALSIETRARIVAFVGALTSYVNVDPETMFLMPPPSVECLISIVPRFDILPELSNAYLGILKNVSKNETVFSFMQEAFYSQCNSAADDAARELEEYNSSLNEILESDKEYKSKEIVADLSNLRIGKVINKLLAAVSSIFISKEDVKNRSDAEDFFYELTERAKAIVDKVMPVLEETLVLLDRLSSKEVGWPKGDMGIKCFKSVVDSITGMIVVVINRLVVDMKTPYKVSFDNDEGDEEEEEEEESEVEFVFDENQGNDERDENEGENENEDKDVDENGDNVKDEKENEAEKDVIMDNAGEKEEESTNVIVNEDSKSKDKEEPMKGLVIEIEEEEERKPIERSKTLEEFYAKHSSLITKCLKIDPSFIIRAFYPLMYVMPDAIDFESKQWWFSKEVSILKKKYSKDKTVIKIRRDNILEDSFSEILKNSKVLKSPIKVAFEGEEASDAGGPRREWYQEISRTIADPKSGLFTPADNGAIQPNPLSGELRANHLDYFRFAGLVVGKALWDGETIDLHFIHSFYKRILSRQINIHDMEAKDHQYYESLMSLLNTPGAEDLSLDFTVQLSNNGVSRIVPLVPDGENIEVDDQNKKRYVNLVINFELVKSTRDQTREFIKGFREFIPKRLTRPFTETQLELLISGMPVVDVEDLRKNTIYCNGYTAGSDVIAWFWRAVESYSGEEKAMLLQFITGSGKVPAGGFNALASTSSGPIKISRSGSTDRLPTTHTCFNQIEIPPYESYEELYKKLTMAIYCGYKGFGFI